MQRVVRAAQGNFLLDLLTAGFHFILHLVLPVTGKVQRIKMIITIHSFIAACAMASNASAENSLGSTMAFSTIQSGGRRRLARRPGDGSLMSTSASIAEGEIADCPDDESYVVEFRTDGSDAINDHRFNANAFASSNCWGRRPFLMRNAFDPHLLLDDVGQNHDERGEEATFAWPSWEEVVEIAADEDSESR